MFHDRKLQLANFSGSRWAEQELGLQWLGGARSLNERKALSKYLWSNYEKTETLRLQDSPELPAMSMWEYLIGWLLFAWCLSRPATYAQVLENIHPPRLRTQWQMITCIMKAAGNWCPLGVRLLGALLHCSTETNSPDLSCKRHSSKPVFKSGTTNLSKQYQVINLHKCINSVDSWRRVIFS